MPATREEIMQIVREITAEYFERSIDDIRPEANFIDDLDADSLDSVEVAMRIEEEFRINRMPLVIPDEDVQKLLTVGQVVDYLEMKNVQHVTRSMMRIPSASSAQSASKVDDTPKSA
jgi:acyl carrier protein